MYYTCIAGRFIGTTVAYFMSIDVQKGYITCTTYAYWEGKNEILPGDDLWRPSLLYNIVLRNCFQLELHYELQTMIADVSAASLLLAVAACTSNVQSSKQDLPC